MIYFDEEKKKKAFCTGNDQKSVNFNFPFFFFRVEIVIL